MTFASGSRRENSAGAVTSAHESPTRPGKGWPSALGSATVWLLLLVATACAAGSAQTPANPSAPGAASTAPAASGTSAGYLYVASQDDASVAVIDMATNRLVETVDLTAFGFSATARPHHTAVEPDGSFWYVSLIGESKVLKLDRDSRVVGQADFETPGMLALDPESGVLYVARSMAAVNPPQRVGVIDRATMDIEEVDVFFPRPHALVVDAGRFYTASMGEDRIAYAPVGVEEVDLLDVATPRHQMIVQLAVSPDGRWMVGGGQMSGTLLVFDLSGPKPVLAHSVDVGDQPWHPVFSRDGAEVWVPNQTGNAVTVVETGSWSVVDVVRHPALVEPHGSAISPDGRTVYVSSHNVAGSYRPADGGTGKPGTVVAIDRERRQVIAVVEVGPYAAGMSAAPARAER